jgi:hypothetical protein
VLEHWLRDCGFAVRSLRRSPVLALSMVVVLGLGIGLGTAMLTILHTIVWRGLPVPDPDSVVKLAPTFEGRLERRVQGNLSRFSYPELATYRDATHALTDVAGFTEERLLWRHEGAAAPLSAVLVTGDYFHALRVPAATGRLLTDADSRAPIVVISQRLWADAFAGSSGVLGATMVLDRQPFTVVGVVAAPFAGTEVVPVDVWVPLEAVMASRPGNHLLEPNVSWLMALGRLGRAPHSTRPPPKQT